MSDVTTPGRFARLARRLHLAVGWAAMLLALCHLVAVSLVGRARDVRWLGVERLIGAFVLLPGWWMVRSARRLRLGGGPAPAIAATVLLAGVSIQQLFTWRATFPAVFALLAAVDGFALSFLARRW